MNNTLYLEDAESTASESGDAGDYEGDNREDEINNVVSQTP